VTGQVESEVKLRMEGPDAARGALQALGATPKTARHFEDNALFDDAHYSLFDGGLALRVRRAQGRALVTFKGPKEARADGVKSRREIEMEVGDADGFEAILAGLGFRRVFRYQKYREAWSWRDVEIVLDETPIGTFLEIEGPIATIHAAAKALGRSPADYIGESYAALFFATGRRGDMVFPA
jgi:adenylate cyclase, class 2